MIRRTPQSAVGKTFDRLTVIELAGRNRFGHMLANCICSCGNKWTCEVANLWSGNTGSCGCLHREVTSSIAKTHGGTGTPEYATWCRMINRCYNQNSPDYPEWGGRGISICVEWRHDFAAFLAHVGRRPGKRYSIDRYPNKNGNYEPGNVRWTTASKQARNTRRNRFLEFNGERRIVKEWSEIFGIRDSIIRRRLDYFGWSVEKALTTPKKEFHGNPTSHRSALV